jgi:hypothetical protein
MQSYPVVRTGDAAEAAIMTDAKHQRCSEVETLELLVSSTLDVRASPVVCGGGAGSRDRCKKHEAWFNPSQHVEWFDDTYWRDPQACRIALTASPDLSAAGSGGYRLPITWGSSAKH